MYKFFGVVGLILFFGSVSPVSAASKTITVTQQIKVTATILPARHVIVDGDNKILQIISNTAEVSVTPTVYVGSLRTENIIPVTAEILVSVDKLLAGKTIQPGIVYDRRTDEVAPAKALKPTDKPGTWLSGIFNLKNVNPTVNLTRL